MEKASSDPLGDLLFAGLDPTRPTARQIHQELKSAILSTALPPGCLLSETEIGQRFGASRTPVREAFALLREEGLLVTLPSRGNFVSRLSEAGIRQAQFLREALELANVARLCETGLSTDQIDAIDRCLAEQASAKARDDNEAFQHHDDAFHALLARATGYPRAEQALFREKAALDRLRALALSTPETKARLLQEHTDIRNAICDRNAARAAETMRNHLRAILATLSRAATDNSEFFE